MTQHNKQDPEKAPEEETVQNTPDEKQGAKQKTQTAEAPADNAAQLAALEERAADAEKRAADACDQLLRTAAEYDNFRRRSQKEHDTAFNNGVGYAAFELLPVIDTLEAAAQAATADEEYKKGVLLTLTKCQEIFTKLGITEIDAMGQPFDPTLCNAVAQQPGDGVESGAVSQVIQKGYKIGDKVLRHAMVAVAP